MREMDQRTAEDECRGREGECFAARKSTMDEEACRTASEFERLSWAKHTRQGIYLLEFFELRFVGEKT